MAAVAVAAPIVLVACGSDAPGASGTLPPIATTTTSTTQPSTTTTVVVRYYKVQSGDSVSKIAKHFGISSKDLMAVNGITNPDHIEIGQELKIPPPKQVLSSLPPTTSTAAVPVVTT